MQQDQVEKFAVVANLLDVGVKVIQAAGGDDFELKPEAEIREDMATAINNCVREGA